MENGTGTGANGGRIAGPRCIALVGPFASGKTTLLEAILARTGAITRQGTINEKNTVGDASPEARAHRAFGHPGAEPGGTGGSGVRCTKVRVR